MKRVTGSFASNFGNRHKRDLHGAQRDEKGRLTKTPAGQFGPVAPPSREALERHVEAGTCPWCGSGPYRVLPVHTNQAHGVSATEIRQILGWSTSRPVASKEFSDQKRDDFLSMLPSPKERVERAKAANAALTGDDRQRQADAAAAHHRAVTAERDAEIAARWARGRTLGEIAVEFEMNPHSVRNLLQRTGVNTGDSKRRAAVKRDQRELLDRNRSIYAQNRAAEGRDLLSRWAETDGSWESLESLAEATGRTRKSLAARLRGLDAVVPDGRAVSPRRGGPRPEKRGQPNDAARSLTRGQVAEIQAVYARGGVSQRALAERYGVSQQTVSRAVHGKFA